MSPTYDSYGFSLNPLTRKRIVLFIDVIRSNGNGDPDNGGNPRRDLDGHVILSNQSIKRIPRDYATNVLGQALYFARDADLGALQESYQKAGGKRKEASKLTKEEAEQMIRELWDLRVMGGILTRADVKVKGAFQVSDGRSIDPANEETVPFTRTGTVEREKKPKKGADPAEDPETFQGGNMGSYAITPYALVRVEISYDALVGQSVGITPADIEAFYAGLVEGWEHNRSAHRTGVNLRCMYVFDSPNARGTEPSHVTAARVKVVKKPGVETPARFDDYTITVDERLPQGMTLVRREDGVTSTAAVAAK